MEILVDWNFWHKDLDVGIPREDYLGLMEKYYRSGMIVSVAGLRRSGKSTLMLQFAKKLINKKKVPKENILYINFEDSRFLGEYSLELLNAIWEVYLEKVKIKGGTVIFLDEIQNIKGWEKFVNSLFERKAAGIFVSGSKAELLRSEFSAVLTGRQLALTVYPADFKEFLSFHGIAVKNDLEFIHQKPVIKRLFGQYFKFGGLPKAVLTHGEEGKMIILRNYVDDILNRDIINHFKIRQAEKLRVLLKFYFTNISSLISFNKLKAFLRIPLATIERFSEYATYPYLFYFVSKFAFSLKEQAVNPRKVYVADVGLRNAVSFDFSEDKGKILENLVFLNFLKKGKEVYYYKTKNNLEVDFVVKEGRKIASITQVCNSVKNYGTKEREIKALVAAMNELHLKQGTILTEDEEDEIVADNKVIIVKPIYRWLFEKDDG